MSNIKIEKNVRMPRRLNKYPLSEMNVGDSFLVEEGCELSLRQKIFHFSKKTGKKFSVLKTPDGKRCWRTK